MDETTPADVAAGPPGFPDLERARVVTLRRRGRRVIGALLVGVMAAAVAAACSSSGGGSCPTGGGSGCADASCAPAPSSALPTPTGDPSATFAFPVAVSQNHRYLVDQHGDPFMMVGDSPQCLSANLSTTDMEMFFADRQAHGFNTAWVNLLCGTYTRGRKDASTYDHIVPFEPKGDLASPNPDYFARMDTMVEIAARHGITLLLDPAETGSFRDLLRENGDEKSEAYGEFLGRRYQASKNIIWMLGNDYQRDQWKKYDRYEAALSKGLRSADPAKLQTVELDYYRSTSFDDPVWPPLIDLASAYTYYPTYDAVLEAYNAKPTQPVFMVEANYEFENNTGGPKTTDETLRRQEYWTMLSGATGQLYGNGYTWGLNDPAWKEHLDTPAVTELGHLVKLLRAHPWQDLVPDQAHRLLAGGGGTYAVRGDVLKSDAATAAVTADGRFGLVYVPTGRTLDVDLSRMSPGVTAQWFDPTDGSLRPAAAPFKTPGRNHGGDEDWVLVLEAGPAGPPASSPG